MAFRDRMGGLSDFYKYDPREFNPNKCCRIQCDAYDGSSFTATTSGSMRHANYLRNASGTLTHTMQYDDKVANFFRFTAAASSSASRAWLTERVGAFQPTLLVGIAEMDFQAMVKVSAIATGVGANAGFVSAHGAPGAEMYNQVGFECYNSDGKWIACTNVNNAVTGIPIFSRVDTGVSALDWCILRVWVNKKADRAVWSINDKVVREETNPDLFPTWENLKRYGEPKADIFAAQIGMQAACRVRADDSGTNQSSSMDMNWFVYRFFRE